MTKIVRKIGTTIILLVLCLKLHTFTTSEPQHQFNHSAQTGVKINCGSHASIHSIQWKRDPLNQQASDILDLTHTLEV